MNNIPNILTSFRIFLIPIFVIVYYLPVAWSAPVAAFIFWLAGITDILDGYLARKLNQSTPFGAFLDPVADKIMVAVSLVMIVEHYAIIWVTIPAMIMICREIIISALREWMAEIGQRASVAVSRIGKIKTFSQMMALFLLIWQYSPMMEWAGFAFMFIATVLTLWSMVVYLKAAWPALSSQ
ncbi:CDP-diacylglycerol--glycerol-3-phosphate 3-phosphatidyltransferase [Psychromonas sp. Urea-02u-13]|uniref:CDP-diacylglycerol--glycerol-3-phosphate 3-phosphatidyltransferase n=1 Tax=Psychromonas sp. Urea-02u-13 TaxID=2058326 RepID=UPI000C34F9EF|nr:CDP-diacylglycerol--glycerol-3-phosphate 3-phosphatidyltransferase [Psychromonas sp. Urea-02u-13]PKG37324.1 CDP-diacylglycerol--glycerol-3-phosphate 3-phosphatidyltransferase [Psychromonas sp. Urea-02u-13]